MNCTPILLFSALAFAAPAWGQSSPLVFDFSRAQHKPGEVTTPDNHKVPAGTVELVDGQFGKACKFSFVAATGPQFFTAGVRPSENWDEYEGFSFWVKGDGSTSCGGPGSPAARLPPPPSRPTATTPRREPPPSKKARSTTSRSRQSRTA